MRSERCRVRRIHFRRVGWLMTFARTRKPRRGRGATARARARSRAAANAHPAHRFEPTPALGAESAERRTRGSVVKSSSTDRSIARMLGGCRTHLAELKVVRLLDGARGRARLHSGGAGRDTPDTRDASAVEVRLRANGDAGRDGRRAHHRHSHGSHLARAVSGCGNDQHEVARTAYFDSRTPRRSVIGPRNSPGIHQRDGRETPRVFANQTKRRTISVTRKRNTRKKNSERTFAVP